MMRIWAIATNTLREAVRDKVLHSIPCPHQLSQRID